MSTKKYAVVGHPIGHSLSPFIHEKLFEYDNIDALYIALDVENLDEDYDTVLKSLDGYNVTIPHKQNIITKLDLLSEKAKLTGSVNTVKNGEKTKGYTTDGYGFLSAVKAKCSGIVPKDVLIFGYGGAARAIAFECIENGCSVSFAVRKSSISNCEKLKAEIKSKLSVTTDIFALDSIPNDKNFSLLVNATPVGMYPHTDGCIADDEIIKRSEAVFDSVYNPLETVLLRKAKAYGKNAIGSVEMLVYQAAKSHEIWVGAKYDDSFLQDICRKTEDKLR
ncbi:MAG: shikimate dehydrogenase [Ruminococcus sp.]|nr:shikimate dehydrogenase [Ruminococcus sp.]